MRWLGQLLGLTEKMKPSDNARFFAIYRVKIGEFLIKNSEKMVKNDENLLKKGQNRLIFT